MERFYMTALRREEAGVSRKFKDHAANIDAIVARAQRGECSREDAVQAIEAYAYRTLSSGKQHLADKALMSLGVRC